MQINFWFKKNSDLHLRKKCKSVFFFFFNWEKFRSASKEDANQFFDWEKSRPASNEDEYQFLNWEKLKSASNEDAN